MQAGKVKHLLFEHQNNITQLKADGENALAKQQEDFRGRELEAKKEQRSLRYDNKELELANEARELAASVRNKAI